MGVLLLVTGDTREGEDGRPGPDDVVAAATAAPRTPDDTMIVESIGRDHAGPESARTRRAAAADDDAGEDDEGDDELDESLIEDDHVGAPSVFKRIGRLQALRAKNRNVADAAAVSGSRLGAAPALIATDARPRKVAASGVRSVDDGLRSLQGHSLVREPQVQQQQQVTQGHGPGGQLTPEPEPGGRGRHVRGAKSR